MRLAVGGFFVGHGTQKLFGWFGGGGLEQTAQMFENGLGLRPGRRHALAAGVAEAGGGALLVLGAATPISAAMITATMITAVHRVHLSKGPWITNGGYEYNVVLIAAVLALAETGPGSPSVDSARGSKAYGPGYAALALALGILGAAGAHAVAGMTPAPEAAPADAPAQAPAGEAPAGEAPAGEAPAGEAPADSPAA
ncbi:MAG TPA: DoxX family protein [Solirubrobacteraceae bacterium]|nr:DoxX family protein [Solirubrobacteraceae bacterium]